jgi:hypothetical protein
VIAEADGDVVGYGRANIDMPPVFQAVGNVSLPQFVTGLAVTAA